jgi:hypothetical protein
VVEILFKSRSPDYYWGLSKGGCGINMYCIIWILVLSQGFCFFTCQDHAGTQGIIGFVGVIFLLFSSAA